MDHTSRDFVITGPPWVGKGFVSKRLALHFGYAGRIDTGALVRDELRKLGELNPARDRQGDYATARIREFGPGYFTQDRFRQGPGPHVIDGPRRLIELKYLLEQGSVLCFMEATPANRFARSSSYATDWDQQCWKDFVKLDLREFGQTDELLGPQYQAPADYERNLKTVRGLAHVILYNDGTLEQLLENLNRLVADLQQGLVGPPPKVSLNQQVYLQRNYGAPPVPKLADYSM